MVCIIPTRRRQTVRPKRHAGEGRELLRDRYALLQKGLFPETLPPCFTAVDLKRALRGIVPAVRAKELHKRSTDYVRYGGTKHDGSRRFFGTPYDSDDVDDEFENHDWFDDGLP